MHALVFLLSVENSCFVCLVFVLHALISVSERQEVQFAGAEVCVGERKGSPCALDRLKRRRYPRSSPFRLVVMVVKGSNRGVPHNPGLFNSVCRRTFSVDQSAPSGRFSLLIVPAPILYTKLRPQGSQRLN